LTGSEDTVTDDDCLDRLVVDLESQPSNFLQYDACLVKLGVNVDGVPSNGITVLDLQTSMFHFDVMCVLLEEFGFDIETTNASGVSVWSQLRSSSIRNRSPGLFHLLHVLVPSFDTPPKIRDRLVQSIAYRSLENDSENVFPSTSPDVSVS
jgi:hypothetical protein